MKSVEKERATRKFGHYCGRFLWGYFFRTSLGH